MFRLQTISILATPSGRGFGLDVHTGASEFTWCLLAEAVKRPEAASFPWVSTSGCVGDLMNRYPENCFAPSALSILTCVGQKPAPAGQSTAAMLFISPSGSLSPKEDHPRVSRPDYLATFGSAGASRDWYSSKRGSEEFSCFGRVTMVICNWSQ